MGMLDGCHLRETRLAAAQANPHNDESMSHPTISRMGRFDEAHKFKDRGGGFNLIKFC